MGLPDTRVLHGCLDAPRYLILVMLAISCCGAVAEPPAGAVAAFNSYVGVVESHLADQHRSTGTILSSSASDPQMKARLRSGEFIIEQLTTANNSGLPGAMLHDWRGTAFAPGAKAADFERLMRNYSEYPRYFSPQVVQAKVLSQKEDGAQVLMRIRQKHVITVVMDTSYDITYGRLDSQRGYSISRSMQITEISSPGTAEERAMTAQEEHGFMWRMNTYWTYEERDGGLYMQIESVTLTRSIPTGLAWIIRPFVESIPRESLEFTLRSACAAVRK